MTGSATLTIVRSIPAVSAHRQRTPSATVRTWSCTSTNLGRAHGIDSSTDLISAGIGVT
jgi:hypothetical protein